MPWQVGGYTTEGEKPFDQGSFGTVWRARRLSDGARVALKLVLLTETDDARDRIAAERHGAMLQQRFEQAHGMVPTVYDYGHDSDGHLFIAMELVEGGALADLIKNGPLPPRLAAEHAVSICTFLEKAHQFATTVEGEPYDRLVHADLKPGHVLIGASGSLKVLDFGIAKALAKTSPVTTNNWGTSAYASPERLEHGHVNEHVDFWSLGVILYEAIAGHRPYPALDRNRGQLEHAIRTNAPREPLPPSCPPELAAIVSKLLAYQVERRYPTAAAIRSDLELFLAGKKPAATSEYTTPATMPIGQATARRATEPLVTVVPPTDPLPAPQHTATGVAAPPPVAPAALALRRIDLFRRALWMVVLLTLVGLVTTEGVAWVAAERFREGIDGLERNTIVEKQADYDGIRASSMLGAGLKLRVNGPLKDRLIALADSVITDYRREEPTMPPGEWKQAQQSLRWAAQLAPGDNRLLSKLLTCEAHVIRLSARTQPVTAARQTYRNAIDKFRAAAQLDGASFDPYLGISRIAVYGLTDVDQASSAIVEAEKRGYVSGRRERALLGDGYLRRANASRSLARTLSGEQRRRELEKARADYEGCIEAFDPIVGFGYAAKNLEVCKGQLERVDEELAATGDKVEGS
ncbi:MAG TPA: serine/threonine-protein kinase [Vicinamibacterales bacterium]|nr:serine/threonine-protein kinase [Vicinamibacterales bacterium]